MIGFHIKFKKYKNWTIRFKLLIISTLLILCSVFLVSLLSYIQYTRDFEEQSAFRVQQIIEQVSLNIDAYLDELSRLSSSPYYNNLVMAELERGESKSEFEELEKSRLIESFLEGIMIFPRKDIISVFILTDKIYSSGKTNPSINKDIDFQDFGWYKNALKTRDALFIPAHMERLVINPKFKVFSIVKQLRRTENTDRFLGVIKVDANYTGIQDICSKVNMGQEGILYIIDGDKNIIYPDITGANRLDTGYTGLYEKIKSGGKPFFTAKVDKKLSLVNFTRILRSNWTIVAVNSLSELNKKASHTRNTAFLMAVACSGFAILVLVLFIKRFLNPLLSIVKHMKEIQNGNLSVKFSETGSDEIGYLGSSFNAMVLKINEMLEQNTRLVKEVYEAKFLQKEAQINALSSQIRPHFIYNTLNMLSLLIQSGKYEKAIDNINKLGSMLRNIAGMDKEITLQSEINLLQSYLSIQSSRYDGRLDYSIDIDRSLLSCTIPSLIFQPIVENAVIHGCEKQRDKTFIKIYNTEEDNNIVFNFEDNGKGIEPDALARLQERIDRLEDTGHVPERVSVENAERGRGIGLVNINRRIKIKYGPEYGLKINSIPGHGARVKIILPKGGIQYNV